MSTTRRSFIMSCSAAVAALSGSRFTNLAFAGECSGGGEPTNEEVLLVIFLRGGMDGLNLVPPIAGPDRGFYETARPDLQIPVSGNGAALNLNGQFGLHPSAAPLHDLYQDDKLSMILAAGIDEASRSHFDAMGYMELGTPGVLSTGTGWLTRHLQTATNLPPEITVPALAVGSLQQNSLRGSLEALNMSSTDQFVFNTGPYTWRSAQRQSLRNLWSGSSPLHLSGTQALDSMDIIELNVLEDYVPANGAEYPSSSFGNHLQVFAQMIKLNLGLRVATLDLGGWDTHNGQGDGSGGYFAGRVEDLAEGLAALYLDLDGSGANNYTSKFNCLVMSEFGRRLRENADGGSDHGHGNVMMLLSGNATGGVHGAWPGLHPDQLYDGADVDVTTDYRRVLSEILVRRMANNNLGTIFPGYTGYSPLGIVQGPDTPPVFESLFCDGFETGDVSGWSSSSI